MIQLIDFKLIRLHFDSSTFGAYSPNLDFRITTGYDLVQNPEDLCLFLMVLRLNGELKGAKPSANDSSFEVHCAGEFRVPEDLDSLARAELVRMQGGMLLYGLIRGQLSMITSRFACGSILLPVLDWPATVRTIEEQRDRQLPEKSPAPRAKKASQRKSPLAPGTEKPHAKSK